MVNDIVAWNGHWGVSAKQMKIVGQGERGGKAQERVWQRSPAGRRALKEVLMSPWL
jgi:hypothetical protein